VVLGDTYSGYKVVGNSDATDFIKPKTNLPNKCLIQILNRFSIAMTDRQWILRNEIIWKKPNCIPSSAKDRFTVDFEKLFFFVKSRKYYFKQQFEPHLTHENRPNGVVRNREYGYNSKSNAISKKKYALRNKRGGNKNPDYRNPKGRNKRCVWSISTKPYVGAHSAVYPPELIETPIRAGCPPNGIVLDPFIGAGTTGLVARGLGRNYIGIELNPSYIETANNRLSQCNQETLFEKEVENAFYKLRSYQKKPIEQSLSAIKQKKFFCLKHLPEQAKQQCLLSLPANY